MRRIEIVELGLAVADDGVVAPLRPEVVEGPLRTGIGADRVEPGRIVDVIEGGAADILDRPQSIVADACAAHGTGGQVHRDRAGRIIVFGTVVAAASIDEVVAGAAAEGLEEILLRRAATIEVVVEGRSDHSLDVIEGIVARADGILRDAND